MSLIRYNTSPGPSVWCETDTVQIYVQLQQLCGVGVSLAPDVSPTLGVLLLTLLAKLRVQPRKPGKEETETENRKEKGALVDILCLSFPKHFARYLM